MSQLDKSILNAQHEHWQTTYASRPEMFGIEPSAPARGAAALFQSEHKRKILELGSGQGRDTIFFLQGGFEVCAVDYSEKALRDLVSKAEQLRLGHALTTACQDVRTRLPFEANVFDACFSHMLYCMALTTAELASLSSEIRRVLKPGGLNVYTVRNTNDPDYHTGIHRGEDMYEPGGGFIVHFFTREKVEQLASGYEIVSVEEFEEGGLPKRLFKVTLRKRV